MNVFGRSSLADGCFLVDTPTTAAFLLCHMGAPGALVLAPTTRSSQWNAVGGAGSTRSSCDAGRTFAWLTCIEGKL